MVLYLIRYSEIGLKGKNRTVFEKKLVEDIKKFVKNTASDSKIKRLPARILLDIDKKNDLHKVFGIASYSVCKQTNADLENLYLEALNLAEKHPKTTTFKVNVRRVTKTLPLSSLELNNKIGAFIVEKTGLGVDLEKPSLNLGIEIIDDKAFVFDNVIPGFGGLPVGIEGKVLVLLSEQKSLLSALLMMNRGCSVMVCGLSDQDFSLLKSYSPNQIVFHKIKMLSEIDSLAEKLKCKALVVADTLKSLKDYPVSVPVLRPLIAFSDKEIKQELEKYRKV